MVTFNELVEVLEDELQKHKQESTNQKSKIEPLAKGLNPKKEIPASLRVLNLRRKTEFKREITLDDEIEILKHEIIVLERDLDKAKRKDRALYNNHMHIMKINTTNKLEYRRDERNVSAGIHGSRIEELEAEIEKKKIELNRLKEESKKNKKNQK